MKKMKNEHSENFAKNLLKTTQFELQASLVRIAYVAEIYKDDEKTFEGIVDLNEHLKKALESVLKVQYKKN